MSAAQNARTGGLWKWHIAVFMGRIAGPFHVFVHIAQVGRVGVMAGEVCARKRLDFAEGHRLPAERIPHDTGRLDAAAYAEKSHAHPRAAVAPESGALLRLALPITLLFLGYDSSSIQPAETRH